MKAFLSVLLLGTCLLLSMGGCGSAFDGPYAGAVSLPTGATFICQPSNSQQQALLSSSDFNTVGRAKLVKFAGAVYCKNGAIFFTADRYTEPSTIAAGSHTTAETGLACSFDVDAACNVTNQTFPAGYFP